MAAQRPNGDRRGPDPLTGSHDRHLSQRARKVALQLRVAELPAQQLVAGDHAAYHILVARLASDNVATAIAFDLDTDCGIYNLGTREHARRRGLGTAVTVAHLYEALDRGCHSASLQSTPMAERLYAAIGFRHLGRILEYVRSRRRVSAPRTGPLS